jgi:hypothetical protein
MRLRKFVAAGFVFVAVTSVVGVSQTVNATTKPRPKVRAKKAPTTKPKQSAASESKRFTCTGQQQSKLTSYTVTGTVDSNITITNVTLIKNFVEVDGAAVSQPTVVLKIADPKRLVEPDTTYRYVSYVFNKLPTITAADVDKFFFVYGMSFPDKMPTDPKFTGVTRYERYKGYEGSLANDQRWYSTDLATLTSECSFIG